MYITKQFWFLRCPKGGLEYAEHAYIAHVCSICGTHIHCGHFDWRGHTPLRAEIRLDVTNEFIADLEAMLADPEKYLVS